MTWRPGHACIEQEVRTLRHGETVDLTALYETYSDLLFRTALTYVSPVSYTHLTLPTILRV